MPMDIRSFFGKPSAKKQDAAAPPGRPKRGHNQVNNESKPAVEPIHASPAKKPKASSKPTPKSMATPPSSSTSKLKSPPPSTPPSDSSISPPPKRSRGGIDTESKPTPAKRSTPNKTAPTLLEPTLSRDSFDLTKARVPECLQGLTFCFTGVLENLHRDVATDLIKSLGGRVTNSVSGKTSYLVVGPILEDGRPYEEGKKYQTALEKQTKIVLGEEKLYGLCHLYQSLAQEQQGQKTEEVSTTMTTTGAAAAPASSAKRATIKSSPNVELSPSPAAAPVKVNPYASKTTSYAMKVPGSNPYAKKSPSSDPPTSSNPYAKNMNPYASNVNPYSKNANPYAKSGNPYSKSGNPYTKSGNPYAKDLNPYSKPSTSVPSEVSFSSTSPPNASSSTPTTSNNININQLWVDRHAPQNTRDILGNKDNITKLAQWLQSWERTFNNPDAYNKTFNNPKGPWKAALLSGPPGIGKTTTATLVAKEAGRDLREFNASDARSKKALQNQLGDLTGSQSLGFTQTTANSNSKTTGPQNKKKQLRCIIMDEVDGMGAGDRSGMSELIQMIKKSKVPIICICNDRQSQKMKSLLPYCMDLRFKRPTKTVMANRAVRIAELEGLKVERNAAEAIAESCGNDVRQVLNVLQMWAQKKGDLTYQTLKERESSIQKDEILRVGLFDAAKSIMEGRKGLSGADVKTQVDSLFRRSDAFFVDYSLTGLLVQQNYPKVMQPQYSLVKQADNASAELTFLNRMHEAAESMSDYAVLEHAIRSGDLNWSLLPACSMMAVKTGYHAGGKTGGNLPGYPDFTAWMGKNSSKTKKQRLLYELHHHMNFKISADSQQLRESYLPVFRERFLAYFQGSDRSDEANDAAIQLMDDYGLSREDVMEKLDEFKLGKSTSFADLDSKQKAAFTRRWNQGSHRSQALVQEELGLSKPKRGGGGRKRERDPQDLDAIDEDNADDDEDDASEAEDEEAELKKVQEKFKKKGRGKSASANTTKSPSKRAKKGR